LARANSDAAAAPGNWTITGDVAIASQYRYRGISQSDNRPAVQGAITITHASGFYLATWDSSASAGNSPVNIGGTEIDIYGGFTHALGQSGVVFDGGLYGYVFPGASQASFYEIYGSLAQTLGPATAKIGGAYAPAQKVFDYNVTSQARSNMYAYAELSGSIPKTPISLHSHVAHTGGGQDYTKPYIDYCVGATAKWKNLALDLSLVGTNITRGDFARSGLASNGVGGVDPLRLDGFYRTAKPVAVLSLTASF
jgi:uncharacterized protein (TIGR02001 family)